MTGGEIDAALSSIHARTRPIYDRQAHAYDRQRTRCLFEKNWLDRFLAALPLDQDGAKSVLDTGCGGGEPIASYLMKNGVSLTGVDFSPAMIAIAKARFPNAVWIEADMRVLDLAQRFAGVVSWNALFHLSRPEQREALPLLGKHVAPGGALMLTIGDEDGERTGMVNGETVYHSSLEPAEYDRILGACGFAHVVVVTRDATCKDHSIVLATGLNDAR